MKRLPDSLNALLYLCFNIGPVLVKAIGALTAAVGFFLVGVTISRFVGGKGRQKQNQQQQQQQQPGDFEYGNAIGGNGGEDDDDDNADGKSGLLIVDSTAQLPFKSKSGDRPPSSSSYLSLHRVDYDRLQDRSRGR